VEHNEACPTLYAYHKLQTKVNVATKKSRLDDTCRFVNINRGYIIVKVDVASKNPNKKQPFALSQTGKALMAEGRKEVVYYTWVNSGDAPTLINNI
jgi:hypothetical protein